MIELRRVGPLDDELLLRLYASTRAAEMATVPWTEEEQLEFVEMQFRAQLADYESRFPHADHSVVLVDGEPVGRVWVDRGPDEIRLLDVTLLPERRDRGTGTWLLERLMAESRAAGVPLRHSVFTTNVDALRFYERLGFVVVEDFEMYVLMEWSWLSRPGG